MPFCAEFNSLSNSRVNVPNNNAKILLHLVWIGTWLFYIQTKIFFHTYDLWILLFPMIYNWSSFLCVITEKSAVYDRVVHLLLLGTETLITTPSKIIDPNNNAPAKYMQKPNLKEKKLFFTSPVWDSNQGPWDNFVERIKLYHIPAVREKSSMI